ncbi:hypothetical protein B0H14DRAFT_2614959 [Mycena olivaceomarginata]|nr:hypothetical protein B0H14DRAFT_2614959 [Mycena olivaceomarginata]
MYSGKYELDKEIEDARNGPAWRSITCLPPFHPKQNKGILEQRMCEIIASCEIVNNLVIIVQQLSNLYFPDADVERARWLMNAGSNAVCLHKYRVICERKSLQLLISGYNITTELQSYVELQSYGTQLEVLYSRGLSAALRRLCGLHRAIYTAGFFLMYCPVRTPDAMEWEVVDRGTLRMVAEATGELMAVRKENAMLRGSVKVERRNLSATSFCHDSPSYSF